MPHVAPARVCLVEPIQRRLAQRHDRSCKSHHGSQRATLPTNEPLRQEGRRRRPLPRSTRLQLGSVRVHEEQVEEVEDRFNDVQGGLRGGEAVLLVEGFPAVDVVRSGVQLVRGPNRPVQGAAGHGEGAQEDIACVLWRQLGQLYDLK